MRTVKGSANGSTNGSTKASVNGPAKVAGNGPVSGLVKVRGNGAVGAAAKAPVKRAAASTDAALAKSTATASVRAPATVAVGAAALGKGRVKGPVNVRAGTSAATSAEASAGVPEKARGVHRAARGVPAADPGELLSLSRARDELGLDYDEFDVALQVGEVRTVVCGPGVWKVPRSELLRLRAREASGDGLLERLRLVSSGGAAEAMGIGRDRFTRLARAGCVRPVRWYVNQYRAVVWLYLAREVAEFGDRNPAVLTGRLTGLMPGPLREADDAGTDLRARGWRARRAGQLVRDAADAWEEAAVWAALLGPAIAGEAVPDAYERAHLYRLRAALPPGRPGRATPEQVRSLTTADAPDEIAAGLFALAEALGRARAGQPVPRPSPGPLGLASPPPPAPELSVLPEGDAVPLRPEVAVRAELPAGPEAAAPAEERAAGARRGLRRLLGRRAHARPGRDAAARPGRDDSAGPGRAGQSSPTSVTRTTARPSSSDAARSTSAEMPQP